MPYITASIIMQLLRVVIPRFEDLHKEGQAGTAKLTQYTRYLTIGLAVLQSTTIITLVRSGNFFVGCSLELIPDQSIPADRKSTRLNSSHVAISYAVFCLKKKKNNSHYEK